MTDNDDEAMTDEELAELLDDMDDDMDEDDIGDDSLDGE